MLDSELFLTQRQNKTAHSNHRHRVIRNNLHRTINNPQYINQRPFTTSLGRTQPLLSYRKIQEAEEELSKTFQEEMSVYVKKKFRILAEKHKEIAVSEKSFKNSLASTITNPESSKKIEKTKPRNFYLMKVCGLSYGSPAKVESVLGQPYLVNTKQRLSRILSRKRQVEEQYNKIKGAIKEKQKKNLRMRKQKDLKFKNPQHVANVFWDYEWRNNQQKQAKRYQSRLENKHKKQNSSLTIQW